MANRNPDIAREPLDEFGTTPATRAQLETLRAKVNLLEYGGITADKLGGGTISTQSIEIAANASVYSGSSSTDGFVLDVNGLRFYKSGANTINLRADGGTATFTGTITASTITGGTFQTAMSGKRMKISSVNANLIEFFSGHASETVTGAVIGNSSGDVLEVDIESPRAGFDYAIMRAVGRSTSTPESQVGFEVRSSAGALKGGLILGSKNGTGGGSYLAVTGTSDIFFDIEAGAISFARPAATNALQVRFWSLPASGTSQIAIGVDNGAAPNRLNVQSFDGVTALPISASAFTVISKTSGKKDIKSRSGSVLNKVKALRPVDYVREGQKYEAKKGEQAPASAPDSRYVGFLAEEMMTQFPEAVVRDTSGNPHSIDLMAVVAILTQAVQELANG